MASSAIIGSVLLHEDTKPFLKDQQGRTFSLGGTKLEPAGPGYPTVDEATLEEIYKYSSFAQAAYYSTRTMTEFSLGMYYRVDILSKVKEILYLSDSDDPLVGNIDVDTESFAALMDDGELVLGFRGTEVLLGTGTISDWATDFYFFPVSVTKMGITTNKTGAKVHVGFQRAFTALADPEQGPPFHRRDGRPTDIRGLIRKLERKYPTIPITRITCCGHSLGGALATLAAYWCKKVAYPELPVYCYTYGSPRVGNKGFADEFNRLMEKAVRVTHQDDPVPTLPPSWVGFYHVGQPVLLCRPGVKSYGLGPEVAAAFKHRKGEYIAAVVERPWRGVYVNIVNHFIWHYGIAIGSVLGKEEARPSLASLLSKTHGVFDTLTLVQRVLLANPQLIKEINGK